MTAWPHLLTVSAHIKRLGAHDQGTVERVCSYMNRGHRRKCVPKDTPSSFECRLSAFAARLFHAVAHSDGNGSNKYIEVVCGGGIRCQVSSRRRFKLMFSILYAYIYTYTYMHTWIHNMDPWTILRRPRGCVLFPREMDGDAPKSTSHRHTKVVWCFGRRGGPFDVH